MRRRSRADGKQIKARHQKSISSKVTRRRSSSTAGQKRKFAQLSRKLNEALEQQTATAEVLKVISTSPGDLQPVFQAMLENAMRICESPFGGVFKYENGKFEPSGLRVSSPELERFLIDPGAFEATRGSGLARLATTKAIVRIEDLAKEDPDHPAAKYGNARTVVWVPMVKDDDLVGAFVVTRQEVRPFTDKQIALLQNFAAQAVIAIENTRLLNELRESLQQQTATADVLKVISSSPGELGRVFQALLENAVRICGAKFGNLFLSEDDALRVVAFHNAPQMYIEERRRKPVIRPDPTFVLGRAMATKQPVQIADVQNYESESSNAGAPDTNALKMVKLASARTVLAVPMVKENELVGVISIYRQEVRPFTHKQIELMQNFAAQAVIAIENARLLNELRQRTDDLSRSLEDLRTAQDRLVQTEKLASLGQLTAGIAHEIKNPLNFVNNFSVVSTELIDELRDTLKGMPFDNKARAEINELTNTLRGNLDKVVQHGKRADAIVKNMLLHSRQGSAEHRPVDINALVEESLNLAYHGARAEKQGFNITLERSLDPAAGDVDVFPQDVTRVLLNLISNGFYAATKRKAQADGGDYEPTLMAGTRNLGESVEITIRDNGTGILPDVKERMFNPFFTTKPAGEGTGLGLSISHDIIVKQHGGSIEIDTTPGEFTEIKITLPRSGVFPTELTAHA
jgi:signal transduction histidine kinase